MASDDDKQRSGNNIYGSGSSKSSKKFKQKKVPQRGLGVAQLEKIRLEEQQKKDVTLQSCLQNNNPVLLPKFRQNPAPQIESNPVFKTNPGSDFPNQISKTIGLAQKGSWGKLWNGEQILNGIPAKEFFQSQNYSSSMVRVSSGTSSSSVITYNQMEPPSNQSFYSKICNSSKWPEEDKMIGIKRPYPFSLENPQGLSYHSKFLPVHVQHPVAKSVESPSCVNEGLVHVEPKKLLFPEEPANLSAHATLKMKTEKLSDKNADLKGDFLTLALPEPQLPHSTQILLEAELKSQGVDEPGLFDFFTSSNEVNDGATTSTVPCCNAEVAEKLDLNLKL